MIDHTDRTITVELSDSSSIGDDLRLDDFLDQLRVFRPALRETERLVSTAEPSLYFRIKRLHKSSPPIVTLEAVSDTLDERARPEYANSVVRRLTTNLRIIAKRKRLPANVDYVALDAYRNLTPVATKRHLEVKVRAGRNSVTINHQFLAAIDKLSGDDEFSCGSVSGNIEAINLHDKNRNFQLFPIIGASKIFGTFKPKDRKLFASAVDKYVTVYGRLRYKAWDRFPYAIKAESIEIHNIDNIPSLDGLKGIAPHATGSLSSQEFIDRTNDEW